MNQDDFQKMLSVAGPAGAVGFAVSVFRGVIDQNGGWKQWLAVGAAAILVSAVAGLGLHDTNVPLFMQYAIVGLCAYIARDILTGVTQLSGMLASNPIEFFKRLRAAVKGEKSE